jgi:predicted amidohydrolase
MLVGVVQLNSGNDWARNIAAAVAGVRRAVSMGAELVSLPETFACIGTVAEQFEVAEEVPGAGQVPASGSALEAVADVARELGVHVLAGSVHERVCGAGAADDERKVFNTSVMLGPSGEILAKYRKIHLFDVADIDQESASVMSGRDVISVDLPFGRAGMSICYDLRFAELYRQQVFGGATMFLTPSAFSLQTGKDHWELLVRARAVENQVYVVAANQWGPHPPTRQSFGHSMIVDPWGTVVCRVPDGVGVAVGEVDFARVDRVRARLPALAHAVLGRGDEKMVRSENEKMRG